MKDEATDPWGIVGNAIRLYFHPLTLMHRKMVAIAWVLSMAIMGGAFYTLGQKVDAIEVEPIVRFNSNDSELEERVRLYENFLVGLLVCTDAQ